MISCGVSSSNGTTWSTQLKAASICTRSSRALIGRLARPAEERSLPSGDRLVAYQITVPRLAGKAESVPVVWFNPPATAVDHAVERWGDPGEWLWLLHDDCAPEPDCLAVLLRAAEVSPSVDVLGPLALDWADPRLVCRP